VLRSHPLQFSLFAGVQPSGPRGKAHCARRNSHLPEAEKPTRLQSHEMHEEAVRAVTRLAVFQPSSGQWVGVLWPESDSRKASGRDCHTMLKNGGSFCNYAGFWFATGQP